MRILLMTCNVLCVLFGIYHGITSILGVLLKKKPQAPVHAKPRRIAAVIAARNEEDVIGDLVHSLMEQDYPKDLFDVYVIPNNCTDRTEERARQAGARIISCIGEIHSKGDALRCAFSQLTSMDERYDAYCVFDADNLVDPHFLSVVSEMREQGYHVAQGYRDSKNPYDSWVSGCMSVFYWFMSRFYNGSRAALGMSCALNGTGFMVSDQLIRSIGWNTCTLTEDLEFSALCALNGYKIGWMPQARVYDEQPIRFSASFVQRHRWSAGSLQCMRLYSGKLFQKGTLQSIDMGVLFCGMLLNLIGAASLVMTLVALVLSALAAPEYLPSLLLILAVSLLITYVVTALGALLIFCLERRLSMRSLRAIVLFPVFILSWMPINLLCFITRAPQWKVIRHTSNSALPR